MLRKLLFFNLSPIWHLPTVHYQVVFHGWHSASRTLRIEATCCVIINGLTDSSFIHSSDS
uniref:Uncharacterized protein n=1 Tax=Hippocampus comes TaxID=109280 RepID=A0A3Q2XFQ5_HIPCM